MFAVLGSAAFATLPARAQDETYNAPPPAPESPYTITGSSSYRARLGPQLGARVAYAAGTGVVYSGLNVSDASSGALPIIVDLGWRFLPALYVGAYGQWGHVFTKNNDISCPTGFDCAAQDWRFGVEGDLHFLPRSRLDPYFGVGTGYEILSTSIHGTAPVPTAAGAVQGNVATNVTDSGYEFFNLSLGFDVRIDSVVGLGPFISGSLGRYALHDGTQTVTVGPATVQSGSVAPVDHAMHELYFAGLRGTFNP